MSDERSKIAFTMPISPEMAAHLVEMLPSVTPFRPERRTPEELAAQEADQKARSDARKQAIMAEHAAHLAAASPELRAMLELHAPVPDESLWLDGADCNGCDFFGYEAEPPAWPCRTYNLAVELSEAK